MALIVSVTTLHAQTSEKTTLKGLSLSSLRQAVAAKLTESGVPKTVTTQAAVAEPRICLTKLSEYAKENPRRRASWLLPLAQSLCALGLPPGEASSAALQFAADGLSERGTSSDLLAVSGLASLSSNPELARAQLNEALVFDRFDFIDRIVAMRLLHESLLTAGQPNRAAALAEQWSKREPRALPLLISAYARAGQRKKALELSRAATLSQREAANLPPSEIREIQLLHARILLEGNDRVLQRAEFLEAIQVLEQLAPKGAASKTGDVVADLTPTQLTEHRELLATALIKTNRPQEALNLIGPGSVPPALGRLRDQARDELVAAGKAGK